MDRNKYLSIIRTQEYRELSNLRLDGKILDLGGYKNSKYHQLIKGHNSFVSANLYKRGDIDLVFDLEAIFPIANEQFDHTLCLNVLEHIYNFKNVVAESYRVTKPGGQFILATPFLFMVHGSPNDYFRYTESALEKILANEGFKEIKIKKLGGGIFSLIFQITHGAVPTKILKDLFKFFSLRCDNTLAFLSKGYRGLSNRIPLGYFIVATK